MLPNTSIKIPRPHSYQDLLRLAEAKQFTARSQNLAFLAKTKNVELTRSGFTLIELLVVISIIAILAIMGFAVYAGAAANARDGKRRSDITQLSKAIETIKDQSAGTYKYDLTSANNDFPRGIPEDPSNGTPKYCVSLNTAGTTPPTAPLTNWTDTACPTSGNFMTFSSGASSSLTALAGDDFQDGTAKSWTLCAAMEKSATPFCATSLTR